MSDQKSGGSWQPKVLELFGGCGGAFLGLKRAGFLSVAVCEQDEDAAATLRAVGAPVVEADVRAVDWSSYRGTVDLLWGSPPCQAGSVAGERLGSCDRRNGWPWLVAVVDAVQPRWVLSENVPGWTYHEEGCRRDGTNFGCPGCYWIGWVIPELERRFAKVGWWVMNAADYGDAQHRRRVILWAGPEEPEKPRATHTEDPGNSQKNMWRGVAEILPEFRRESCEAEGGWRVCYPCDGTHGRACTEPFRKNMPSPAVTARDEKGTRAHAPDWDFKGGPHGPPDAAFLAFGGRRATIEEGLIIQGFPKDWPLKGSIGARYRMVGNACPPTIAERAGRSIIERIRPGADHLLMDALIARLEVPPERAYPLADRLLKDLPGRLGISWWKGPPSPAPKMAPPDARPDTATLLPLQAYDRIIVGFSGGKDSEACVLHLWEQLEAAGLRPPEKMELWHHCVDGRPGSRPVFDWPCTEDYCKSFADALGLKLYFSWREGGIAGEIQRGEARRGGVGFETPAGEMGVEVERWQPSSGLFPQQSPDLSVRWCSSLVKVDVAKRIFTNDPRFSSGHFLMVTGERREESANRKRYARVLAHPSQALTKGRIVHQYRPVIEWSEAEVWGILQRWGIVVHPCYHLGFGRASCETCIFSQGREWATIRALHRERFLELERLEAWTGQSIDRQRTVGEQAERGRPMVGLHAWSLFWRKQALEKWSAPIRVNPQKWLLPGGAFRHTAGPT